MKKIFLLLFVAFGVFVACASKYICKDCFIREGYKGMNPGCEAMERENTSHLSKNTMSNHSYASQSSMQRVHSSKSTKTNNEEWKHSEKDSGTGYFPELVSVHN